MTREEVHQLLRETLWERLTPEEALEVIGDLIYRCDCLADWARSRERTYQWSSLRSNLTWAIVYLLDAQRNLKAELEEAGEDA